MSGAAIKYLFEIELKKKISTVSQIYKLDEKILTEEALRYASLNGDTFYSGTLVNKRLDEFHG